MIKLSKNKKTTSPGKEETKKGIKAKKIISHFRKKEEEEITSAYAARLHLPYVDTNLVPISKDDIRLLTEEESKKFKIVVIHSVGRIVTLASVDPVNPDTQKFINSLKNERGWKIKLFVISRSNLKKLWEKYKQIVFLDVVDKISLNISEEDLKKVEKNIKDLIILKNRINELPTTKILDIILAGAYKLRASDVHIEPQEKKIRLRYRIDGVLQDVAFLPLNIFKSIVSRIKLLAKMKINIHDTSQDGAFEINLDNKKIDTRVSIIPGNFGELVVIRILDPDSIKIDVEKLGLQGLAYEALQKQMLSPNGMILNTGPTGSGKTTTLYSIVNRLNTPDKKIITIEDPIEYKLPGISQTRIEKSRGYTFSQGLRSIVRQDPDIILVGEIRDDETADIAIDAALTGHLVLSSLHTNNAMGAIPRLIELGIKPTLITPAINAIVGQRLVRRLCDCKESYVPAQESIESIKKILSIISPKAKVEIPTKIEKLYRPKGCPKCNGMGYRGRIGIFEVLTINEDIEKLILEMAGETDLALAAMEAGLVTMLQDGILKAVKGITSIDEVKRITGQGEFLENLYEKLMAQALGKELLIKEKLFQKIKKDIHNFKKLEKLLRSVEIKEASSIILAAASLLHVGDIHIEPQKEDVKVRFRIDGILQNIATLPLNEYPSFLGEIKMLCGIKTETRQGVLDSRFSILFDKTIKEIQESKIDVRVSIILGGFGETVVMRLLNKSIFNLDINKLGIRKENLEKLREEIKKPNGMILNIGPTGSGKTTTLYSIVNRLNTPDKKIITIEDPIEYQLQGILQTPINEKEGYTFPTALRTLLRQNPDILMIGEIRDAETAQIAIQAALTGRLVLSTIHANSAIGAVTRLANMGIPSIEIATSANAFMAQRLVRRLCDCKEKVVPTQEEKEKIRKVLKSISPKTGVKVPEISHIFRPKGCSKCNGLGYRGQTMISEVLEINSEVQKLVGKGVFEDDIQKEAIKTGMLFIAQDGILKVLEGSTSLAEIERVTDL